jgi:hypothetical protein
MASPVIRGVLGSKGVFSMMSGLFFFNFLIGWTLPDTKHAPMKRIAPSEPLSSDPVLFRSGSTDQYLTPEQRHTLFENRTAREIVNQGWRYQWAQMMLVFRHPDLRRLFFFNLFMRLLPSPGLPLFYFLNNELNFTSMDMLTLAGISQVVQVVVLVAYNKKIKFMSIRTLYFLTAILSAVASFLPYLLVHRVVTPSCNHYNVTVDAETGETFCYFFQYHDINPLVLAISDDVLGDAIDLIRNLPLGLVLIAVCNSHVEASVYSVIIAGMTLVSLSRRLVDAQIYLAWGVTAANHYKTLPGLVLFTGVLELMANIWTILLPRRDVSTIQEQAERVLADIQKKDSSIQAVIEDCQAVSKQVIDEELRFFRLQQESRDEEAVV